MKRKEKTSLIRRTSRILNDNEGASLVLVSIISIIIVVSVVILRTTTSSLWASADKIYLQDKAYVMAVSMGDSIDALIHDGTIALTDITEPTAVVPSGSLPDPIEVLISPEEEGEGYFVTVRATGGNSEYIYSAYYTKSYTGTYTRQII